MKATEQCSCGGSFTAEGRGAKAALIEWRQTHQHTVAPTYDWWKYPGITSPSIGPGTTPNPFAPQVWYGTTTSPYQAHGTLGINPHQTVCEVAA